MVIFENNYSTYVNQNQQQYHWVPADPQYVQGPVQFIYPSDQQQQQQSLGIPMSNLGFQGNPMPIQTFNLMSMPLQSQVMIQSQEPTYCNQIGQPLFDQNQYIIEQPQPQVVPSNIYANPTVTQPVIENVSTNQVKNETLQDHSQLRQALQLNYNPRNKPNQLSSESTPSVGTPGKFWEREMSEEETRWAFEGINDLSYLGDAEFKRLVFSLPY
ncbi:unnamed protein product [Hymenolepis diminuta]|uniref:Uncharacterized protein n=1 Tax=Hymenolepis diminuta TaxID=6216 RepID=A0A564YU96_HYMDI|nr:unnamed protein product [Hymenolepis diminuta]